MDNIPAYLAWRNSLKDSDPRAYKELMAADSAEITASHREFPTDVATMEDTPDTRTEEPVTYTIPVVKGLTDRQDDILDLLQTHTIKEVAKMRGITVRAINRIICRIKDRI